MLNDNPLSLSSWPEAILHIDGDAFFASCEQSIHPELKGRPVITGKERNIVASMSYEAKARGVKRATVLWEARKMCPDAVIVPSDYETYSLISKRMFAIMRHFTPVVEESSIDEGFADLKGLRRLYRTGYGGIAREMKVRIERELDIPISLGLSLTKTLAKLAAKSKKPRGFTIVPGRKVHLLLQNVPVGDVCGIGPNTSALLQKHGIRTALDYVYRSEPWIKKLLGKIGVELWLELRAQKVYSLDTEQKTTYDSISKSKTFTPPSDDYNHVKAQLFRNVESAFIKLRRYNLRAKRLLVYLCTQQFEGATIRSDLNRATVSPFEAFPLIEKMFRQIYDQGVLYRCTGIVLAKLEGDYAMQFDLFEDPVYAVKMHRLAKGIDQMSAVYGKHAVHSGAGLFLAEAGLSRRRQTESRNILPQRKEDLLPGESFRRRVNIPLWQLNI
uniref:Amino acid-binding ACT domain protein n=1 Tax=uncultured bacterium W4-21b TaxID=1130993 RepID=H9BWP6_9BACT|nr:amino acid-binding ACT domain protein [uncultured bacterium W4-21b]